jgi:hypothetical protein
MLFLIFTMIIYIVLESLLKINKEDNVGTSGIKVSTILFFSVLAVNLVFGKSFINLLFSIILIYIIASIRKDSMYSFLSTDLKFDEFNNLIAPSKDNYNKFFNNIKNSFSRVYHQPLSEKEDDEYDYTTQIDDQIYSLSQMYPKIPTTTPDKQIISFQAPAKITVEYDDELQKISEGLMNEFWLTEDKTDYKVNKKPSCNNVYLNNNEKDIYI